MKKTNTLLTHFTFWIGYVTIAILVYGYGHDDWLNTCFDTIGAHLISAGVFYVTALFIFPTLYSRQRYLLFVLSLLLVLFASTSIRFIIPFYIYPGISDRIMPMISSSNEMLLRRFFFQWFTFSLYAFFYWRSTVDKNKAKREKLELENEALRAQINPHYIMNSLDFFRIKTTETDPEVSDGLFWFMKTLKAGITRPEKDGKIKFRIEMDAIKGTINTMKLRFPELQLEESIHIVNLEDICILPHIIQPFIENAFKHGSYTDENYKIYIGLNANPEKIELTVKNKKEVRIKDHSTGIGMLYVKRHLEAGYSGKYNLIINETEDYYSVNLSVQLN